MQVFLKTILLSNSCLMMAENSTQLC